MVPLFLSSALVNEQVLLLSGLPFGDPARGKRWVAVILMRVLVRHLLLIFLSLGLFDEDKRQNTELLLLFFLKEKERNRKKGHGTPRRRVTKNGNNNTEKGDK
jgi:hypothetical protein